MDQVARLCAMVALGAAVARAQDATLSGRVVHRVGKTGISGADVRLQFRAGRFVTDSTGAFIVASVPSGRHVIYVRRLGFKPESVSVDIPHSDPIVIELQETAQALDTVSVSGRHNAIPRGKLAGFYDRMHFGLGHFLEAADIEKLMNRRLSDILLSRVPGIRIMYGRRGGSAAYVYSTRLGAGCYPNVYLDGMVVFSSGSQMLSRTSAEGLFDINSIDPGHVAGIEYYGGPATMPAEYNRTGSACGALLVWTK